MDYELLLLIAAIVVAVVIIIVRKRSSRYHEAGKGTDTRTMQDYGIPARTLYTSTKFFTLHHHIDITDENENVIYTSQSKMVSLHDKTDVTRADGSEVAHIEKKILTLREVHFVTMADGTKFQLSNEILHIIKDVTNIVGLGWRLDGNIIQMNFVLRDANEQIIAAIGQKAISLHDKYCIDIYQPEHEEIVVAILIALEHMLVDRRNAEAAAAGGGVAAGSAASSSSH